MVLWSLVAAGNADAEAADDLRREVGTLLGDPRFGTGVNMLHVGDSEFAGSEFAGEEACA